MLVRRFIKPESTSLALVHARRSEAARAEKKQNMIVLCIVQWKRMIERVSDEVKSLKSGGCRINCRKFKSSQSGLKV